jgi:hypothetical protein
MNINNDQLETNTYYKLDNIHYRWVLDTIIDSFFKNQISNSYNAVRDESWPDIQTADDFKKLPQHIRDECINVHNLELLELSESSPNCPRHILREFFEIGFSNPKISGFMMQQQKMKYENLNVFVFPFFAFYDKNKFITQCKMIAEWAGLVYNNYNIIENLHNEFIKRQPYAYSKQKSDTLVKQIINDSSLIPTVTLYKF